MSRGHNGAVFSPSHSSLTTDLDETSKAQRRSKTSLRLHSPWRRDSHPNVSHSETCVLPLCPHREWEGGLATGLRPVYHLGCEKTEVISSNAEKPASLSPGPVTRLSLAMWGGRTGFTVSDSMGLSDGSPSWW